MPKAARPMMVVDDPLRISDFGLEEDDPMGPLLRKKSNPSIPTGGRNGRRPSVDAMARHACNNQAQSLLQGPPVDRQSISVGMYVVRGPDWKWGKEDDDGKKPGMIMYVDESAQTATVLWASGNTFGHYRFGKEHDLCQFVNDCGTASVSSSLVIGQRRNSQPMFAMKNQTAIVLDWDDTLFPSTCLRFTLQLSPRLPMDQQKLKPSQREHAEACLNECASHVTGFLRLVATYGTPVIVTLARRPWVTDSCRLFYPGVGELLEELGVKIVYAQEGLNNPVQLTKGMSDEDLLEFWSEAKGRAIANVLKDSVYTLYEGQSWKNVISIGDSDFERFGTRGAIVKYTEEKGIAGNSGSLTPMSPLPRSTSVETQIDGHIYKVRTKTLKMLEGPSAEELVVEISMLQRWLHALVNLDDSFDADLNDVNDPETIAEIEAQLKMKI
jgi:hypothetical protein